MARGGINTVPYKSDRQRRYFHTATARRRGISKEMVDEYDEKTRGKDLPESLSQFSPRKKKSHKFDEVRKR